MMSIVTVRLPLTILFLIPIDACLFVSAVELFRYILRNRKSMSRNIPESSRSLHCGGGNRWHPAHVAQWAATTASCGKLAKR